MADHPGDPDATSAYTPPPSGPADERFAPGTLLAGRYRVVARLGAGGMGEVYRADDLTLGQPVALKFLPAHLASDPDRLARFHKEVAAARRVAHPNVCRVYDIGGHEGLAFLTMELVSGEDLSSVLKRLGRVPEEKGVEIAWQLCAALAAVHDQGLLHRDLKPANVLLDGQGKVRLTDFGLAGFADQLHDSEVRSGTPAYMAPEQQAGREVTVQSDLYALGLILYELFTGKHPFPARSRVEQARLHAEATPSKPSSHVRGLDPAVEKVILRCLEKDPRERPASARAVAAALPSGDPLAAALALGETPSPQLVARSGGPGSLAPPVALALYGCFLVGLLLNAWLNDLTFLHRRIPFDRSPEVLTADARRILTRVGAFEPPRDSAGHLFIDEAALEYLRTPDAPLSRAQVLSAGRPALLYFYYVQGPQSLRPTRSYGKAIQNGSVSPENPPLQAPGAVCLFLDLNGHLLELRRVPDPRAAANHPEAELDWRPLFEEAGMVLADFEEDVPRWYPPVAYDRRRAWVVRASREELPWRVEAASHQGRPVYFRLIGPWDRPERGQSITFLTASDALIERVVFAITLVLLLVGTALAVRNARQGRLNTAGVLRVGLWVFGACLLRWVVTADHRADWSIELPLLYVGLGEAVWRAGLMGLAYAAIEPSFRRHWPWRVIAWNRLLEGRWRDPLVSRDLLIGAVVGIVCALLFRAEWLLPEALGLPAPIPLAAPIRYFEPFAHVTFMLSQSVLDGLLLYFTFFILVLLCRREWLAYPLIVAVATLYYLPVEVDYPAISFGLTVLRVVIGLVLAERFGLWALVAMLFFYTVVQSAGLDFAVWYWPSRLVAVATLLVLATFALVRAKGNRPFFEKGLFGDA
jgi:serine/threonine-protein kinase